MIPRVVISRAGGRFCGRIRREDRAGDGNGQIIYGGVLDDPATATSYKAFEQVMGGACSSNGELITFTKQ